MSMYQFLIAVRSEGAQLTSADGETTRYNNKILSLYNIISREYYKTRTQYCPLPYMHYYVMYN